MKPEQTTLQWQDKEWYESPMREVSFERAGASEPTRLLQQVERQLLALGYSVAARTTGELHFVSTHGAPHRLRLRVEPQRSVFTFAPGAPGVVLPSEQELERRVEAALGRVVPLPASPPPTPSTGSTRCSICATVIPAGATVCPLCGMTA